MEHVKRRRCKPLKENNLRPELRKERKALASEYLERLAGHASTGNYLIDNMHRIPSNGCWRRGTLRQVRGMGPADKNAVERRWKACRWNHPRGPGTPLLERSCKRKRKRPWCWLSWGKPR